MKENKHPGAAIGFGKLPDPGPRFQASLRKSWKSWRDILRNPRDVCGNLESACGSNEEIHGSHGFLIGLHAWLCSYTAPEFKVNGLLPDMDIKPVSLSDVRLGDRERVCTFANTPTLLSSPLPQYKGKWVSSFST